MNKIDKYLFLEIFKGFLLIFFIFLSIAWLLQFTRLISLTNLIQVDIFTILYLSLFLIPNLISIILPFVIMFGLIITFLKMHKDREIISIYTLGLNLKSIIKPLLIFSLFVISIIITFNFYLSPKIYKEYKLREYEIRNNINFQKIIISNFIEINENTYLDFKKNGQNFEEVFIKFADEYDNLIFAKNADIIQSNDKFIFNLKNGFKITLIETNKIEKLEFDNYTLKIENKNYSRYDNVDNNTFDIFEDITNKNYQNIFNKILDSLIIFFIIIIFYIYNIKEYNFKIKNILIFIFLSTFILIINQVLKNITFNVIVYLIFISLLIFPSLFYNLIKNRNV